VARAGESNLLLRIHRFSIGRLRSLADPQVIPLDPANSIYRSANLPANDWTLAIAIPISSKIITGKNWKRGKRYDFFTKNRSKKTG
jgi:hypothetical protein